MDKKTGTRILIVIVAALWGYNIYRTVENIQSKQELVELQETVNYSFSSLLFNKDTFELKLPLEDPFLRSQKGWKYSHSTSTLSSVQNNGSSESKPAHEIVPKVEEIVQWPDLSYHGYLSDPENPIPLCLVKMDGRLWRIRIGESISGLNVVQADKEQITLRFNEESRIIKKS